MLGFIVASTPSTCWEGCMSNQDIVFETSRFNLSTVGEHFINPCCFGEDLAEWLRGKLGERGVPADEPGQEDWGWYTGATVAGQQYFVGVGGNPSENGPGKNHGEWRISVVKRRSIWQQISGKNKISPEDALVSLLLEILDREPDFARVQLDPPRPS